MYLSSNRHYILASTASPCQASYAQDTPTPYTHAHSKACRMITYTLNERKSPPLEPSSPVLFTNPFPHKKHAAGNTISKRMMQEKNPPSADAEEAVNMSKNPETKRRLDIVVCTDRSKQRKSKPSFIQLKRRNKQARASPAAAAAATV